MKENWRVIDLQTNSAAMAQFRLCAAKQYIGFSFPMNFIHGSFSKAESHSNPSTNAMVIK